jgi:hypothetical protein
MTFVISLGFESQAGESTGARYEVRDRQERNFGKSKFVTSFRRAAKVFTA